jgi:hypothetical protein
MTTVLAAASPSPAVTITAFIVAVIGAAATFVIGLLNYRSQRQSLRWQRDFREHEIDLMRSAQATDRFTRAIEQLGSQIPHVRMGGIFALERMARDSPSDHAYIVDTLAAFIRERLPAAEVGDGGYVKILRLRAPDAQAALTVLCRPPLSDERVSSGMTGLLDLSRTDLRRADLHNARLDGVSLWGTRLEGANLRGAHLENSDLNEANFGRFQEDSKLYRAGADLSFANLTGAKLNNAHDLNIALKKGAIGLPVTRGLIAAWWDAQPPDFQQHVRKHRHSRLPQDIIDSLNEYGLWHHDADNRPTGGPEALGVSLPPPVQQYLDEIHAQT